MSLSLDHSDQFTSSTSQQGDLVSIIIPNFNHAQYIGDAIQSVLVQKYRNFEIIVVDDGSTDNSREVITKFGDKVKYIWQENQGLSAARNTGIQAARGNYIGLLDADDMYEQDYLNTLMSRLKADSNAAGIYCGYQFVDHHNRSLPQVENRLILPEQLFRTLVDGNFLVPESMFVHRYCYENCGLFDEKLRACEDWDMWLRITSQYKIIGTPQVLTRHRVLLDSMSADPNRMLANRLAVLKKHFGPEQTSEKHGSSRRRRAYGRAYLTSAIEYLQTGDKVQAYDCFRKIALIYPDLLTQYETFYQLGCGDQPKGFMGDLASLDPQRSSRILFDMLGRIFDNPDMKAGLHNYRRPAYANAYFALASLNYGAKRFQEARRFLFSAAIIDPRYSFKRQFVSIGLKSLLGVRLIALIRNLRHTMISC